jgi:uncharacterized protein YndB with AHSA1/START domain
MEDITAQASKAIAASPEAIWTALTTPALVKRYFFGAEVDSDFRVGSPIRWRGEFSGKKYEDKGEVLEARPNERLRMSHWSPLEGTPDAPEHCHVVTYDLRPQGERTLVTLSQSNLTGGVRPADREKRQEFEKNWAMVLDGLEKAVGGGADR